MPKIVAIARAEINVCLFLIVVCCVVLWESRLIPPGSFEPLGSGPIPQATAALIILLCLLTVWRAFVTLRQTSHNAATTTETVQGGDDPEHGDTHQPRYRQALVVCTLTALYCLVLHSKKIDFSLATVVFLFLAIGYLVQFKPKSMLIVSLISVLMGFGCQFVFTKIFVVDLPGAF